MLYNILFKLRKDLEGLSATESLELKPSVRRVKASNATRAISSVVNDLKAAGVITGKGDIVVLEAKVGV